MIEMSYEGVEYYLCERGHMSSVESMCLVYGPVPKNIEAGVCEVCDGKLEWHCSVDETNGYDENDPHTFVGEVKEIGFTDLWKNDHYGNEYAMKLTCFEPVDMNRWKPFGQWEE